MTKKKTLIIHIGLGKTATTTLQNFFFREICEKKNFIYNPIEFKKIFFNKKFIYSNKNIKEFKKRSEDSNILISDEHLINWNPRNWEYAANQLLKIFGEDAIIIITIRKTLDYLNSLYCQRVAEGMNKMPEEFFLKKIEYDILFGDKKFYDVELNSIDVDELDFTTLKKIYTSRFKTVYFLPINLLSSLYPWKFIFNLNETEINKFNNILNFIPKSNRSLSNFSMKIYFFKIFLFKKLNITYKRNVIPLIENDNKIIRFSDLSRLDKVKLFPSRLINRIYKLGSLRYITQEIIDKLFFYKKFEINNLKNLNNDLFERNDKFLKKEIANIKKIFE